MLDVLLKDHDVVSVFLARHVYPQVASDVGLVIANVAPPVGLDLFARVDWATGADVERILSRRLLRRHDGAAILKLLHVVQMLVRLHVD